VLRVLIAAHLDTAKEKNACGDLALHRLCANGRAVTSEMKMVELLLAEHPDAAREKGGDGGMPVFSLDDLGALRDETLALLLAPVDAEAAEAKD
jgi:hypothetical protein